VLPIGFLTYTNVTAVNREHRENESVSTLRQTHTIPAFRYDHLVPWKRDDLHKPRRAAPRVARAQERAYRSMEATSNAARRDAPPGRCVANHPYGTPAFSL